MPKEVVDEFRQVDLYLEFLEKLTDERDKFRESPLVLSLHILFLDQEFLLYISIFQIQAFFVLLFSILIL
jgi:hypothetical protein